MAVPKGLSSSQVLEITECSICAESFVQPKNLPCGHTFCLHCMEQFGKDKKLGLTINCPLCRKAFTVPSGGLKDFPNNYFILQLLQLSQSSSNEQANQTTNCELCTELNEQISATVYCIECRQHLCQPCCTRHKKVMATAGHQVVNLKDKPSPDQLMKMATSYCEKHVGKEIEFYCYDCKVTACVICYVSQHSKHKCSDVKESAEEFRVQLKEDIAKVAPYLMQDRIEVKQIEEIKRRLITNVEVTKKEISRKYAQLKSTLELHEKQLMSELKTFQANSLKEFDIRKEEIERQILILETFSRYCGEMKDKAAPGEVSRAAGDLHARANELIMNQNEMMGPNLPSVEITFTESATPSENLIGQLAFRAHVEASLIVVEMSNRSIPSKHLCNVSLQRQDSVSAMDEIPASVTDISQACVHGDSMYVTAGETIYMCSETWRLDIASMKWFKCKEMMTHRCRHCAAIIGSRLYVLGGWMTLGGIALNNVECYDIKTNEWSPASNLIHAVQNASCITYKNIIYVFGGATSKDVRVADVQVYNPAAQLGCTLMDQQMPYALEGLRVVLWETSAILMHSVTCLVYNFETKTWLERKEFKTDGLHFGFAIDHQNIYVAGGGTYVKGKENEKIWKCTDKITCLSVLDIIEDRKPVVWKHHAKLPKPALISTCCVVECPLKK